jgi:hypothetical protein
MPSQKTRVVLAAMFCLLLTLVVLPPASQADGLTASSQVSATEVGGVVVSLCSRSSSSTPLAKSACSGNNWSVDQGAFSGNGATQSFAEFGILGTGASATATAAASGGAGFGTGSVAAASWDDSLSFTNLDQIANLKAVISLTGTSVANCFQGDAICGSAQVDYNANFGAGGGPTVSCGVVTVGTCTMSLAINPQSVVDFAGFLSASAGAGVTGNALGSATVSANYYDTAMVDSLLIVDANGNVIQGANIISASGTNYNTLVEPPPVGTPEPSSLMMLGVGLLGLAGLTLKKSL